MTKSQALVLAAHGSHLDPGSSRPAYDHADRVRESNCFDQVQVAFWKEEPALNEVLSTLASQQVFVVPLMMAEGYFTDRVFPRELGLLAGEESPGTEVAYTPPVGSHESMTEVIVERAGQVASLWEDTNIGLAVVGHGTERSETSARTTRQHADGVRSTGQFNEVRSFFLDQAPFVDDLINSFHTTDIVVVPLFIADGLHATNDLPALIGLPASGDPQSSPASVGDHRVWWTGAVGTAPRLTDVILELAFEAGADPNHRAGAPELRDADETFLAWIASQLSERKWTQWGELAITNPSTPGTGFELRHWSDRQAVRDSLTVSTEARTVREIARFDETGQYRPLPGATTLQSGWTLVGLTGPQLIEAVEAIYPVSITSWYRDRNGQLDVTSYVDLAIRQSGRYDRLEERSETELACTVEAVCGNCVKRREWGHRDDEAIDVFQHERRIPCRAPCSFFLEAARTFDDLQPTSGRALDITPEEQRDPPPAGELDNPANPYRRRYRAATRRRAEAMNAE